jgi:hypothetical protein
LKQCVHVQVYRLKVVDTFTGFAACEDMKTIAVGLEPALLYRLHCDAPYCRLVCLAILAKDTGMLHVAYVRVLPVRSEDKQTVRLLPF